MNFHIPPHIIWQDVPGELALFDAHNQTYSALNGSAAAIWREIGRGSGQAEIVSALASAYGAPREELAADVAAFIADALDKGLLAPDAA